jgi:hypothetical protein
MLYLVDHPREENQRDKAICSASSNFALSINLSQNLKTFAMKKHICLLGRRNCSIVFVCYIFKETEPDYLALSNIIIFEPHEIIRNS